MRGTALFSCDGQDFTPEHVLDAAAAWGARAPLETETRAGLAALAWAQAQDWAPDEALLQNRSVEFRRDRDLRSAQSTHDWMASRAVDLDDFCEYLERAACHEHLATRSDLPHDCAGIADDAIAEVLWPQAVFSGHADAWCLKLAGQAAAVAAQAPALAPHGDRGTDSDRPVSETVADILAAYEVFEAETLTDKRLEQVLRARWQELFIVDCAHAVFASEAATREALLCVREDGVSLEAVAREADAAYARGETLLCALPDAIRTQALCAAEGDVLEPVMIDGAHVLYRIGAKAEPRLDNAQVRGTAAEIVMNQTLRPLLQRHIEWHLSGSG